MGDFNFNILHHGSHNPESTFLNVMLSYGFLPAITKPSRVTDLSATLLDNIFTNFDVVKCKSALLYEDISDQYPVMLSYSTKPPNKNCPSNQSNCKKRVFNQKSIEKFQLYCANDANWYQIYKLRNSNSKDPNLIYEEFLDIFNNGFNKCFPKKSLRKIKNAPRKEWITIGLAKSCEVKSSLYKISKQTKMNEDKMKFTTYRNKLKTLLSKAEKDFYSSQLNKNKHDPRKTWQCINSILSNKNHSPSYAKNFNLNNTQITDTKAIVENFNG